MIDRRALLVAVLIVLALTSCGNTEPKGKLVSETYTVVSGDTLDEISYRYMAKSAVRRDVREFREGIIQENWDAVFKDRQPYGLIHPGDRLQINYWVE